MNCANRIALEFLNLVKGVLYTVSGITNKIKLRIGYVLAFIVLMLMVFGCKEKPSNLNTLNTNKQYGVASSTLSPDNKKIVFSLSEIPGRTDIAVFNIQTKELKRINPTGKSCLAPVYSHDGKRMAFASGVNDDWNVFVMNADGTNIRQLTQNYNTGKKLRDGSYQLFTINGGGTFSPDGEKIIFLRSRVKRQRSMGGEMVSHWDVYEVDLATGKERQLTDYRYYTASRPYYLPDSKGVIFSATGAKGAVPEEMSGKTLNQILIVDDNKSYPYLAFEHDNYAIEPSISGKGDIAFVSRNNEFDSLNKKYTYDIFMRKRGKTTRLTMENFSTIADPFISFDGSLVVFLASKTHNEGPALWLVKADGTSVTYIGRPWNPTK